MHNYRICQTFSNSALVNENIPNECFFIINIKRRKNVDNGTNQWLSGGSISHTILHKQLKPHCCNDVKKEKALQIKLPV